MVTPLGNENLAVTADPSNPSNMVLHEDEFVKGYEEYKQEAERMSKESFLSCYMQTEQGVVKIKEWQPSSTIAILKEIQSSSTMSTCLSYFVCNFLEYLIGKEDSLHWIHVIQKLTIEKPANAIINPYKVLPTCDVVGQKINRSSVAKIVDLKSPTKSIEIKISTSTLKW